MPRTLRAVRPNAGVQAWLRAQLDKMIGDMHRSVTYWLESAYENNPPATMAQDARRRAPSAIIREAMVRRAQQWLKNFDEAADRMAEHFSRDALERSDTALRRALRQHDVAVKFSPTPAVRDAMTATVQENVGLIKSIPRRYLEQVEGIVMRSVQTGRDAGQLSRDLQKQLGVTRRRAALIARDQNNKATSAFQKIRQQELGIEEAIWLHSGAGKHPRPTHRAMSGKKYDVAKGMYDPHEGRNVWPGELINCRCVSRAVVPGL